MKYLITLTFCMLLVLPMVGQQEIILTKYTFNQMFFNPAYAGSNGKDQGSASLQYRNQWLGVEGAPQTVLAGAEYSFFENSLGLGMTMAQEKIGVNSNSNLHFNSAYRIRVGEGHLSGGIRAGITHISSDFSNLSIRDEGDIYGTGSEQITLFNVGAGILFHQEAMKIGFSLPTLVSIGEGSIDRVRHFYSHMEVKIGDDYSTIKWQP
ncbi:MAG: PorP/SprF family type IX secretion system membrane protein, partial [Saprospiraceae bacterium]|nr:PorP/SprF family type IX secretion system membrane protein [Saprospiraceae bacterium]